MSDNYQTPKVFIQGTLVEEIGKISKTNAYLSFALIALGIEFLGRCDDSVEYWHQRDKSEECFNRAIEQLMKKYQSYRLYDLLRCGYAHYLAPQKGLGLSEREKHGTVHLSVDSSGNLILNIEDFYNDFKCACEKVIDRIDNKFYKNDGKMYKPFLIV